MTVLQHVCLYALALHFATNLIGANNRIENYLLRDKLLNINFVYLTKMKELIDYILQLGNLSKQHIDLIEQKGTEIQLEKDAYFSEAGKIPRQMGILVEGVMRACYYNNEGQQVTRCFICEDNMVVDYVHFEANTAATEYLQAITTCKLIVFSKQNWEELCLSIAGWDTIKEKMVQKCMFQKFTKGPVISQDATTRYEEFMENYPSLTNRVPLAYIASFLGVTQQSLSRIRRNIR